MYYRIEINPQNIGKVLETPFSLNPSRVEVANKPSIWSLLNMLVDLSISMDTSIYNVCNEAIKQNVEIAFYLPGIWEVLMERARPKAVPYRRTDCTFFFENKEDALLYQKTYPNMDFGKLCSVTILNEIFSLKCDMNWLDSIDERTVKANDAIKVLQHYWAGEKTLNPKTETLFVGKYQLNQI